MEIPQEKIDTILSRYQEEVKLSKIETPDKDCHAFRAAGLREALVNFGILTDELSHLISIGKWKKPVRENNVDLWIQ